MPATHFHLHWAYRRRCVRGVWAGSLLAFEAQWTRAAAAAAVSTFSDDERDELQRLPRRSCCRARTKWRLPLRWRAFCTRFAAIVAWGWGTAVARVAATWLDWRRRFALSTPALAAYTTWLLRACAAASRFACTARLTWPSVSSRTLRVCCAWGEYICSQSAARRAA